MLFVLFYIWYRVFGLVCLLVVVRYMFSCCGRVGMVVMLLTRFVLF